MNSKEFKSKHMLKKVINKQYIRIAGVDQFGSRFAFP